MKKIFILSAIILLMLSAGYSNLTNGFISGLTFDNTNLNTNGVNDLTLNSGNTFNSTFSKNGGYSMYCGGTALSTILDDNNIFDFNGDKNFTMSLWFISQVESPGNQGIFARNSNLFNSYIMYYGGDTTTGSIIYGSTSNGGSGSWNVFSGSTIATPFPSANDWVNLIITKQGLNVSFYEDGSYYTSVTMATDFVNQNGAFVMCGGQEGKIIGHYDEFYLWDRALTLDEITTLNADNTTSYYPFYVESSNDDFNITSIFDNSSYNYFLFNSTAQLNFNAYDVNNSLANWSNALTLNITAFNISQNFTSGEIQNIFLNQSLDSFDALVFNPLNTSQNETFTFYIINIADYLGLIYNNTNILINSTNQIISDLSLISNITIQINDTLNDILNITNITYEEITFLKKLQMCYFKQYESVDEYNYYCEDWKPFNPFRASEIKKRKDVQLNVTIYLLNQSVAEQETVDLNVDDCFNTDKYLGLLNATDYFIVNSIWAGGSIFIDFNVCWIKWGLKAVSIIK